LKDVPTIKDGTGEAPAAEIEASAASVGGEDAASSSVAGGEVEDLKAQLRNAKTSAERTRLRSALIARLVESDREAYAVEELRAMLAEEGFDPAGFYNIGNALARLGESSAAADAYRKAISQRHGNYSRAQNNLGVVLIRLGRWDEAQQALAAALRLESNNYPEASYNLGRMYALRGEAGLAINAWTRALAQQSDHAEAAVALARAFAEDGDPARGLAVLDAFDKRMTRRGADSPRAIAVARGEIVAASHVAAETKGGGKTISSVKTEGARAHDAVGSATRGVRASPTTLRALAVDQQSYDLLQRARAAREAGRHEESVALYRRVIQNRGGYFPPANLELGYALASLQRNEEAVASLLPVTTREGTRYPIAFYHLGRLYEHLGQLPRAVEAFSRAASIYGQENPQFFIDLSRVREKEGNRQAAFDAMDSYVRAMERTGGAPEWARERLAKLRRTDAHGPEQTNVSTKP
jgi:tetratricopeptide (TPR) repeat protein